MHNAAFAALGLDWRYVACEVAPENLATALEGARVMGFCGVNLTVPHKVLALGLMDGLDASAEAWGGVNTVVFEAENGGAILWQHLFWFFGHPEVYILALPFFGIASEIIPVFSRKPIFGYKGLIFATLAIGALSMAVWAHHLYVT